MISKSHYETPTANKQAQLESDVRALRLTVATLTKRLEELENAESPAAVRVPVFGSIR